MSPLMLSVVLALASAVAYAAAAIVQERVAASVTGPRYAPLRSPAWWGSVLLNGVGATLHVAALAYGPLSLVQPLGALTIVFALPMAALFVGRRAGRRAWRGALMATVGLAGLLSLTSGDEAGSLADGERWLLAGAAFGAVAVLFTAARLVGRSVLRSIVLAAAAGVSFGIASVLTKAVAEEWTPRSPLAEWTGLLVLSVFAVTGLLLSQASYRGAGLAAPLATVTVVNPVVAAAVGLTLFGESFRYGAAGTVAALICGTVAAAGLVQLTLDRMTAAPDSLTVSSAPMESSFPASEGDSPRAEVGQRVDVGAVPGTRPNLEVEVRSRAVAGRS
ncbi:MULTISPECIES: DMT family transporter [Streptomyces]|uniref:Drug/metabolite transporter (DMT)-like permease n=1 Tax=Streptomyces nymphaeiformis TaxID=2663842 RepID=A0A7W7U8P1_9ACTN|nr:DMT family transporter [Streptomyces nymphaeiformis]MBB4986923.1 drug/metabolite transporter (DMT)-like permease [Streptomyces nymphaeiformis]